MAARFNIRIQQLWTGSDKIIKRKKISHYWQDYLLIVVFWVVTQWTIVSEEHIAFIFRIEDGDNKFRVEDGHSKFLQNVRNHLQDKTAS